jgi:hypothetical protein
MTPRPFPPAASAFTLAASPGSAKSVPGTYAGGAKFAPIAPIFKVQ